MHCTRCQKDDISTKYRVSQPHDFPYSTPNNLIEIKIFNYTIVEIYCFFNFCKFYYAFEKSFELLNFFNNERVNA